MKNLPLFVRRVLCPLLVASAATLGALAHQPQAQQNQAQQSYQQKTSQDYLQYLEAQSWRLAERLRSSPKDTLTKKAQMKVDAERLKWYLDSKANAADPNAILKAKLLLKDKKTAESFQQLVKDDNTKKEIQRIVSDPSFGKKKGK